MKELLNDFMYESVYEDENEIENNYNESVDFVEITFDKKGSIVSKDSSLNISDSSKIKDFIKNFTTDEIMKMKKSQWIKIPSELKDLYYDIYYASSIEFEHDFEESSKYRKSLKLLETEKFHRDSTINFADQIEKYIKKHSGNVNSVVNDVSVGLFMAFSNYYKNDGDQTTDGSIIMKKIFRKVNLLFETYPELETMEKDFSVVDEDNDIEMENNEVPSDEEFEENEEDLEDLEEEGVQIASGLPADITSDFKPDEDEQEF